MKTPKIHTHFAIVDVTKGRKALARHFEARPAMGLCPADLRIPIVLRGYLSGQNSGDDGTSIEFTMDVESFEFGSGER